MSAQQPDPAPQAERFAGYAALFDRRDGGRDVIRAGAFARSLAARRWGSSTYGPLVVDLPDASGRRRVQP